LTDLSALWEIKGPVIEKKQRRFITPFWTMSGGNYKIDLFDKNVTFCWLLTGTVRVGLKSDYSGARPMEFSAWAATPARQNCTHS